MKVLPSWPVGTVLRAPAPSFAHVIKLDQGPGSERHWYEIDAYGPMADLGVGLQSDAEVEAEDYMLVYAPMADELWALMWPERIAEFYRQVQGETE